jgi:hypothetical protein
MARAQDLLIRRSKHQISHILTRQRFISELGILIIDDGWFNSPSGSSGIRKELSLAATIHRTELRNGFVDGTTSRQKSVILKDDVVVIPHFGGNTFPFFRAEDNTMAPISLTLLGNRGYL